jgi:hypothetical protein
MERVATDHDRGMLVGRRQVLLMLAAVGAVGAIGPMLRPSPARADESEPLQGVPEDSGGAPWA